MAKICYEAIINCYNEEQESLCSDQGQPDLIPTGQNADLLNEACCAVLEDDDVGFIEKVFEFQTRISRDIFLEKLSKEYYGFLQPHSIRFKVRQHLKELLEGAEY